MVCTKYLIRCSLQCHHTFIHKDHTVRDIFCEFHLMSHDHHGDIQIRQRFDDFSTSPVSSGSSAEVGSSKNRIFGFSARLLR